MTLRQQDALSTLAGMAFLLLIGVALPLLYSGCNLVYARVADGAWYGAAAWTLHRN